MSQSYPIRPEPSLSLPIRMEKKRKRTKVGTMALVAGCGALAGAVYNFTGSGSELIATYLSVLALILLGVGTYQLKKAASGH